MEIAGLHLTAIGNGDCLLEPNLNLDIGRPGEAIEAIAGRLREFNATRLYYDLEQLAVIEPVYYNWLDALARACRLINVNMVCIHMQPTAAFALAQYLQERPLFETALDVAGWKREKK